MAFGGGGKVNDFRENIDEVDEPEMVPDVVNPNEIALGRVSALTRLVEDCPCPQAMDEIEIEVRLIQAAALVRIAEGIRSATESTAVWHDPHSGAINGVIMGPATTVQAMKEVAQAVDHAPVHPVAAAVNALRESLETQR